MAIASLIPLEEYLSTSYDPDREYVDGRLVERNVGELDHSYLQFGVPNIWVVDPIRKTVTVHLHKSTTICTERVERNDGALSFDLDEFFREMPEIEAE